MKKWIVLIDSSVAIETLPKLSKKKYWFVYVTNMPEKMQFIEVPTSKKWYQFWK